MELLQLHKIAIAIFGGFPSGASSNKPACQCRIHKRRGLDSWVGRSPGGEQSNPLQYSCLENPMDRGAWRAMVHRLQRVGHDWGNLAQHIASLCANRKDLGGRENFDKGKGTVVESEHKSRVLWVHKWRGWHWMLISFTHWNKGRRLMRIQVYRVAKLGCEKRS